MARRRFVCRYYTQRIRIRLRGVIIQTCDTYGGHEKKPRAPLRQSDVIAASSTCGAMPRALRRPLNAPLRMSTRMCGAAAGSYHPTRPTREPRRAPWPLQSSAGCRSNPPAQGDPTCTHTPHKKLAQKTVHREREVSSTRKRSLVLRREASRTVFLFPKRRAPARRRMGF